MCIGPRVAKNGGVHPKGDGTTAATATARSGDDGGGDNNDDNFAIAMVINLDLHTAGVQRYVARLNLTGGMAVSLFFQRGGGGGGGGGGGEGGRRKRE